MNRSAGTSVFRPPPPPPSPTPQAEFSVISLTLVLATAANINYLSFHTWIQVGPYVRGGPVWLVG